MGGHLSHLKPDRHSSGFLASCGPVRGNIYRHGDKSVDGFLGIPYAKPPIGKLRFEKPVAADIWTETRDCFEYGPRCPPSGMFYENTDIMYNDIPSEDNCLTLNVFRPRWNSKQYIKRPVMVFIHGGGFELASQRDYCDYSLSGTLPLKDVIVVTANYRLGLLGFLTTGAYNCRGNFALWDQTLALQWVQDHIASFGGNPDNVTIFGQSAGGVSVDLLALSPHSRDLFHKVIPMSGCAHVSFAIRTEKSEAEVCMEFARCKGFEGDGSIELLNFFKNVTSQKLSERTGFRHSASTMCSFCPNFDGDFFPKPLEELRKEAPKKPVMMGITEQEGLLFAFSLPSYTTAENALKRQIEADHREDIFENSEYVQDQIYNFYLEHHESPEKALIAFTGDTAFNVGALSGAESYAKNGNDVYFYVFDYCNPDGFGAIGQLLPFKCATHCTDLRYVLGEGVYSKFEPSEEELNVMDRMCTLYTNFAKFGNPNPIGSGDWEVYSMDRPGRHYHIGHPSSQMRDEYLDGRCAFLEEIREKNKNYQAIFHGKHL